MDNINGLIMQLSLNERGGLSRNVYSNVAIDYQIYNFVNYKLTLSRNMDKILPEYLILNLHDNNTPIETIYKYGSNIYINFQIGNQTLLNIPLSILWNLKEPEICDNKLYLKIPFEMFFGNIHIVGLQFREVTFNIVNHSNLSNYISDYSLLCKTYIGDSQYRRNNLDTSSCCIQQISSLEVRVSLDNSEDVSNEFRIRTNMFPGFSKGFFIESSNINELNNMQFYINGETRTNYNRFMIRNKCQRLNSSIIFFPFNPDISFEERSFNSFVGSINLSEIIQSTLKLNFDTPRHSVKIYSINMNEYTQRRSQIISSQNIINTHLVEDFTRHSLMRIERIETNQTVNDIRVNTIFENNMHNIYNIQYNDLYSGMTGSNYYLGPSSINSMSNSIAVDISSTYATTNAAIDDLIVDIGVSRLIPEEKRTCGINLEEICLDQRYMSCVECSNNFNEISIRIWLTNRRTCPSCRVIWSDFNIYINNSSL